jgi:methylated-DNA-[protein]-cysteine S-methyltransferase
MVERVAYEVDGWGVGELVFADGLVAWHELPRYASWDDVPQASRASVLVARLRAYFSGERESFRDVELDLDWCTTFQRDAVEAIRSIPYGETATYGEIAALAGHPNAQRAVGSVCAANRFGLFVPCHRVVAADGLGSYGSLGTGYKRRLLELERVVL